MKVETIEYSMCATCADIVTQGYSDAIDDPDFHQDLCNHIGDMLGIGHYWLDGTQSIYEDYTTLCEGCGVRGVSRECYAAYNVKED